MQKAQLSTIFRELNFQKSTFLQRPIFWASFYLDSGNQKSRRELSPYESCISRKLPPLQSFADNWSLLSFLPVTACVLIYAWCHYKSKVLQRMVNVWHGALQKLWTLLSTAEISNRFLLLLNNFKRNFIAPRAVKKRIHHWLFQRERSHRWWSYFYCWRG